MAHGFLGIEGVCASWKPRARAPLCAPGDWPDKPVAYYVHTETLAACLLVTFLPFLSSSFPFLLPFSSPTLIFPSPVSLSLHLPLVHHPCLAAVTTQTQPQERAAAAASLPGASPSMPMHSHSCTTGKETKISKAGPGITLRSSPGVQSTQGRGRKLGRKWCSAPWAQPESAVLLLATGSNHQPSLGCDRPSPLLSLS